MAQDLLDSLFREIQISDVNYENTLEWLLQKPKTIIRLFGIVGDGANADEDRLAAALLVERLVSEEFHLLYPIDECQRKEIKKQLLQCLKNSMSETLKERVCKVISEMVIKIVTRCGPDSFSEFPNFLLSSMKENKDIKITAFHTFIRVWHIFTAIQDQYLNDIFTVIQSYLGDSEYVINVLGVKLLFYFIKLNWSSSNIQRMFKDLLSDALETIQVVFRNTEEREDCLPVLEHLKEVARWANTYLRPEVLNIFILCVDILRDENSDGKQMKMAVHIMSLLPLPNGQVFDLYDKAIEEILEIMANETPNWIDSPEDRKEDDERENEVEKFPLYYLTSTLEETFIFKPTICKIDSLLRSDQWTDQVGGLNAISAMSEFCWYYLDVNANRFFHSIEKSLRSEIPYVRYAACLAISNLSKHCHFIFTQEFHDKIVSELLPKAEDTWRVQSIALIALRNYIKYFPRKSIELNKKIILEKLQSILVTNYRGSEVNSIGYTKEHLLHKLVSAILITYECLGLDAFYGSVLEILLLIIKTSQGHERLALVYKCVHCVTTIAFNLLKSNKKRQNIIEILLLFLTRYEEIPEDPEQLLSLLHSWSLIYNILGNVFMEYFNLKLVNKVIIKALSSKPKKMFPLIEEKLPTIKYNPYWNIYVEDSQQYGIKTEDCEHIVLAHKLLRTFLLKYPRDIFVDTPIGEIYPPISNSLFSYNSQIRMYAVEILHNLPRLARSEHQRNELSTKISLQLYKAKLCERNVDVLSKIMDYTS